MKERNNQETDKSNDNIPVLSSTRASRQEDAGDHDADKNEVMHGTRSPPSRRGDGSNTSASSSRHRHRHPSFMKDSSASNNQSSDGDDEKLKQKYAFSSPSKTTQKVHQKNEKSDEDLVRRKLAISNSKPNGADDDMATTTKTTAATQRITMIEDLLSVDDYDQQRTNTSSTEVTAMNNRDEKVRHFASAVAVPGIHHSNGNMDDDGIDPPISTNDMNSNRNRTVPSQDDTADHTTPLRETINDDTPVLTPNTITPRNQSARSSASAEPPSAAAAAASSSVPIHIHPQPSLVAEIAPTHEDIRREVQNEMNLDDLIEAGIQKRLLREMVVAEQVENRNESNDGMHEQQQEPSLRSKRNRLYFIILGAVIMLAVIVIAIVLALRLPQSDSSSSIEDKAKDILTSPTMFVITTSPPSIGNMLTPDPTGAPLPSLPPSRPPIVDAALYDSIFQLLAPTLMGPPTSISQSEINDPTSNTYIILIWMVTVDLQTMEVLQDETLTDEVKRRILLERYCMLDLYHSLNGEGWIQQLSFYDPSISVCQWNDGITFGRGIRCNADGYINVINIRNNRMAGIMPSSIFYLKDLEVWILRNAPFEGTISTYIGQLSKLSTIELADTHLSGTFPTEIGELTSLTRLDLFQGRFGTTIPTEIGNCNALRELEIEKNPSLIGTIPTELGKLSNLLKFFVFQTNVEGTIPSEFMNLQQLTEFLFAESRITGNVDPIFCIGEKRILSIENLWSDCGSSDTSVPPRVACSCCTGCCAGQNCAELPPQPFHCNGMCVACSTNDCAPSCSQCPYVDPFGNQVGWDEVGAQDDDSLIRVCHKSCSLNATNGICETRTEFGMP
mmetsp:Transcript_5734/g.17021  ORF Transcript_5734/g.17021 Transcript_5734/m.17021 type:complete len:842 (-) Transcript_5734:96-2621(-)